MQNAPGAQVVLMMNGQQVATGTAAGGTFRAELPGFANPGNYEVTASVGEVHASGTITVVPCPPVCALKVTPAETKSGQEAVGEFEAAVGGKLNFRDNDNSAIFADLAINGVFSKGFIGGGVSFWDLNLTDTRAVALLIHGGFHLVESGRVQLLLEGRVPFDQFDDVSNNYQFWGGLRIRF